LIIVGWHVNKDNTGKRRKQTEPFRPARPEDVEAIRTALGRIEAIAGEAKGETAVYCRSMVAALCSSMQDHAGAEKQTRKILELDPRHQQAAEQLQQALYLQEKKTEQLQAAQILAETSKTPRNCYLLAKSLAWNQRNELAQQMCIAGLRLDPDDVLCGLGLAALLMKQSDDAKTLEQTQKLLDKARATLRPEAGMYLFIELDYLASIHQALIGEPAFARLKLERMQAEYPDATRFDLALSAITR
jgi:hypothetical protein